jgi:tRNA(fMet)-specific endonuclease VapC
MAYLLDTNTVSDLVRRPQGVVAERIRVVGESEVATSIIVAAELRFGAAKKGSERLTSQLEAVLRVLEVLPFETPGDRVYGDIRARLEREGRPIGAHDLLIAAQAISGGFTLVTDDREFDRLPELATENWLR